MTVISIIILLKAGLEGTALILQNGTQVAGNDLKRIVEMCAQVRDYVTIPSKAIGSTLLLEQCAVTGILNIDTFAQDSTAHVQQLVERLNLIALPGQKTWQAHVDEHHNLVINRTIQGVEESYKLSLSIMNTAEVRQLDRMEVSLHETFQGIPTLKSKDDSFNLTALLHC